MSKINLQIAIEQIRGGMYSYDDMVKIVFAVKEGFESDYPEYNSPAGKFIKKLEKAIEKWELEKAIEKWKTP